MHHAQLELLEVIGHAPRDTDYSNSCNTLEHSLWFI